MNESSILRGDLLETLLWSPAGGYFLLDRHLARLMRSAAAFAWPVDTDRVRGALERAVRQFPAEPCRVRLCVSRQGQPDVAGLALADCPLPRPMRVAVAAQAVQSGDAGLRHKTTDRGRYTRARAGALAGVDDVLLFNERGELTESTLANVVVVLGGERVTPVLSSGLLPGVMREELLARGEIREAIVPVAALAGADGLFLINSVRTWMPAELVSGAGGR